MTYGFGQIAQRIVARFTGERPPLDGVQLINGGPNAPHLACRAVDWKEGMLDQGDWYGEIKVDGVHALYIDQRLVTLEGQPLNAARHCLESLRELELLYGQPMFFEGEYVEHDGFEATISAMRKGEGHGVLWLFDAVPLSEWRIDACTANWGQRHEQLMLNHRAINSPWVGALKSFPVKNEAAGRAFFEELRGQHYEGAVFKRADSLYRRQRNGDFVRMKGADFTDMRLIDIAGNDKTGARRLVCRDPDNPAPVVLTTGFASERLVIWENRELFLGDDELPPVLVEVKHNGRTAQGKPRHATFSKLRQDKARMMGDADA